MRASVGFVVVHLALVAAGMGLIHALGLVSLRPGRLVLASGLAYLAGVASVVPICIALLTIGVPVDLPVAATVTAGVGVAGFGYAFLRLRRTAPTACESEGVQSAPRKWTFPLVLSRLGILLIAGFLVFGALSSKHLPLVSDDAHIFSLRALALFHYGDLVPEVFTNPALVRSHLDYPLLQPVLESLVYRAIARPDVALIHIEPWIIFASTVAAACYMLSSRRRCALWLPAIAALAVAPGVYMQVSRGGADVSESCFLGVAALSGGMWVEDRLPAHAVLTGLMLGAAASTKNEGLGGALAILIALGLVARIWQARERWVPWLAAAAVSVAAVLPWRLWMSGHDISNADLTPLGTALKPAFLSDRLNRVPYAADKMLEQLGNQGRWIWLFPVTLVVALVAVTTPRLRLVAAFYLLSVVGVTASILFAYWITALPITYHLQTSVDRTVTGIVFVCALGAANLLAALGEDVGRRT